MSKCIVCGCTNVEWHHVFYGQHRKNSGKYGLIVPLCVEHHRGNTGVHGGNGTLDGVLKETAQKAFEKRHTHNEFMNLFYKNYL